MISFQRITTLIFLLSLSTITSAQEGVTFFDGSWDKLLAEAKAQKKSVFVDCYASWCVPCKMMEKEVFPDKGVADFYNGKFINYRIDMEKGEGPELAKRYGVRYYPTLLYIDAEGNLLHQRVGKLEPTEFIDAGKTALDPSSRLGQLNQQYEKGERSDSFVIRYAEALVNAGNDDKASEVVGEMMDAKEVPQLFKKENWDLIKQYVSNTSGKTFQYVWDNRKTFSRSFGEEDVRIYLYSAALDGVKAAGKKKETVTFNNTLLPIIDNCSLDADRERNVLNAKKQFYKAAQDWDKYADAAVLYIGKGYYKSAVKHTEELDKSLKEQNMTYEEYQKGMDANALNGEAWTFYEHVDNPEMLKNALPWIETSVQLQRKYYNLDTYAAVLFKLGETDKAKKVANEAIAAAEKEELDASSTKEMVEKYTSKKTD